MKIGILTLPLHTNYGGILQAYALQTVLERMGHEVVVIDEPIGKPKKIQYLELIKRIIKHVLGKQKIIYSEQYLYDIYPIISRKINIFINKRIHRIVVNSPSELNQNDFDCIIVGSDQIWRKLYYPNIFNGFLNFACKWDRCKKIAYAPSFGIEEWQFDEYETKKICQLINRFDAVSVREKSAIKLLKDYCGINVIQCLDPTMLLTREHYIDLIKNNYTSSDSSYLLTYILDGSEITTTIINTIANELSINTFCINGSNIEYDHNPEKYIKPSIEEWISGFFESKFVITDSFHACVFSLIFNKPFIVIGNKERGLSRIIDILKDFNQDFRFIGSIDDFYERQKEIYTRPNVDGIMESKKKKSLDFLEMCLK